MSFERIAHVIPRHHVYFAVVAFIVDRLTKYIALHYLSEPILIIPGIFQLEFFGNTHTVFYWEWPRAWVLGIIIVVLAYIVFRAAQAYQQQNTRHAWLYVLIALGAFSNLLDRIQLGYVIDFLRIPFWSVFNIADLYIIAGVVCLLADAWQQERHHRTAQTHTP